MGSFIKQSILWVLLLTLVATAGVAIWAVLIGEIGDIPEKVLITCGTVSGACILMLPCLAQTEHKYFRYAAWTSVVLILSTAGLTVIFVWTEPGDLATEKLMGSGWIASAAAFAAFVTLLAKLTKAWTWVQAATVLLIATLAGELIYSVWVQVDTGEKILVTNAILMSLGIISTWVLHVIQWLSSRRPGPGRVMCPRCGLVCVETPGDMRCSRCSTVFVVKA
jgi:hypothetical protein